MFILVYVSSAVRLYSKDELLNLLAKIRKNDANLGITGMMLYKNGNFMQVLEGEETTVRALYARLLYDPEHRGLLLLSERHTESREFPDWSMAFPDLNSTEALPIPGYSEFLNTPFTGTEFLANPTPTQKLLMAFKRSM